MNDWNIQSRARACEACGKPFADQEVYHTVLSEEKADLRRSDICAGCWEKQFSDGARDRKGFISYWQGIYEAPPPVVDAIHKDTAETLFENSSSKTTRAIYPPPTSSRSCSNANASSR